MIHYIFDPEVIDECAMAGIGHPKPAMFDVITKALAPPPPIEINCPRRKGPASGAVTIGFCASDACTSPVYPERQGQW